MSSQKRLDYKAETGYTISLYKDKEATEQEITQAVEVLSHAFPFDDAVKSSGFYALLAERIKANKMTSKRLADAVARIVDSGQYKTIRISDIVSYDKRVKLYDYNDYCKLTAKGVKLKVYCRLENGNALWYNEDEYQKNMLSK